MDLHRTGKVADWNHVKPGQRNGWQKLAEQTHGILTPGNAISALGLGLVFGGLAAITMHLYLSGVILLAVGRLADILDGILAQKTGTKSPLGEAVDASFDKIGALTALVILAIEGLLPWPIALIIALQSIVNILLALYARTKKSVIHPSRTGKLSAVGIWAVILLFALCKPLYDYNATLANGLKDFCYIFAIAAIVFSLMATYGYAKSAYRLKQRSL